MNNTYTLILILVMSAVTILLRFLPFILLKNNKETPAFITYLGEVLPTAVIAMLVVYCLRQVDISSTSSLVPSALSVLLVIFVQAKTDKVVWSVLSGTILYMILIHLL